MAKRSVAAPSTLSLTHYFRGFFVLTYFWLSQIDPKRAIPRSEEKTTDKLFVRNIPPGVTQPMLLDYFGKFGMLTDCTLMMDRDTRQHRGFGFVTFKDEATVDRVVNGQPYEIFGQQVSFLRASR